MNSICWPVPQQQTESYGCRDSTQEMTPQRRTRQKIRDRPSLTSYAASWWDKQAMFGRGSTHTRSQYCRSKRQAIANHLNSRDVHNQVFSDAWLQMQRTKSQNAGPVAQKTKENFAQGAVRRYLKGRVRCSGRCTQRKNASRKTPKPRTGRTRTGKSQPRQQSSRAHSCFRPNHHAPVRAGRCCQLRLVCI